MPLPAIDLLNPACPIKPAWAVFDPVWYLKTYQHQLPPGLDREPQTLRAYYLHAGCQAGHSPSRLFDEAFYLAANPDIAILAGAGHFRSGFDHFCQYGHRMCSPHWLFDDAHYAHFYADMTLENLALNAFYGRYDHYLRSGQYEHRSAHLLFDSRYYAQQAQAEATPRDGACAPGPFTHYLSRLRSNAAELPPSLYFDPAWYLETDPEARAEIEAGDFGSALHHYLAHDPLDGVAGDPVAEFSEQFYRDKNPDVRHSIASGQYRNGYHHFVALGAFELRAPHPEIDLLAYRDSHSRVRNDLNAGLVRDAFAHLRGLAKKIGLSAAPRRTRAAISEAATKQLFIDKACANLALFGRRKLDFTAIAQPAIAVVMILFEKFELTMLALCALRGNYAGAIELILIDNASTDASPRIGEYVIGAKIILLTQNIGYLRACNLGLREVTANFVLFLNNDIELGHGAIAAGLARMQSDSTIGAAGAKIIRTHGKLQEAGSIIWKDGAVTGYMRDASPLAPEANFSHDVDFCSGVFLLCRTETVKNLGGFDADFSPAYYEDADLCLRIAATHRIVYDPDIVIHHLEYGSATSEASMALMRRGQKIFIRKYHGYLEHKPAFDPKAAIFARASTNPKRVLFIEDTVPLRRLGSGYVRANDIVRAIARAGAFVSVFPLNGARADIMDIYGDFPDHLEILHDRGLSDLAELLETRRGYYDAIWISRTHNLSRILPILRAAVDLQQTRLILDTEAIATLRNAARAALEPGSDFDVETKLREEFIAAEVCHHLIAVNPVEADVLRRIGFANVSILGTARDPCPTPNSFAARENLLFVAAIHQPDSPNLDALHWYADAILPALAEEMRQIPVLNVVGFIGEDIDLSRFTGHQFIKIHGPVTDLAPHYNANRLFIAPTRFAAGTPYKCYETAAFGLPCVGTDLLAAQLGWHHNIELLASPVGQAEAFAAHIAHLYRSEKTWNELRSNALARITEENTPTDFNAAVADMLDSVEAG
jgi:GT2 family glycosyltransferase